MTSSASNKGGEVFRDDPFASIKKEVLDPSPSPAEVKVFHTRADRDASQQALHHTLGPQHNQASPGDHIHDGVTSKKLMEGVTITGAKGGNVALTNLLAALSTKLGFTDSTT